MLHPGPKPAHCNELRSTDATQGDAHLVNLRGTGTDSRTAWTLQQVQLLGNGLLHKVLGGRGWKLNSKEWRGEWSLATRTTEVPPTVEMQIVFSWINLLKQCLSSFTSLTMKTIQALNDYIIRTLTEKWGGKGRKKFQLLPSKQICCYEQSCLCSSTFCMDSFKYIDREYLILASIKLQITHLHHLFWRLKNSST